MFMKGKADRNMKCTDTRVKTKLVMLGIFIISAMAFLLFGFVAYFNPMYEVFGFGIFFSRGAALAIIILTMMVLILVSYDTMTCIRNLSCCKNHFNSLFDHLVLYHRFVGYLILIYSIVHTIGHLCGSALHIHIEDMETVNEILTHN